MTPVASRHEPRTDVPWSRVIRRGPLENTLVGVIAVVIMAVVLVTMVDIVRTAAPDIPLGQATFDVAPAVTPDAADPPPKTDHDESALRTVVQRPVSRPAPAVP